MSHAEDKLQPKFRPLMFLPNNFLANVPFHKGADKSLARSGRKQATATEDFDFHISYL